MQLPTPKQTLNLVLVGIAVTVIVLMSLVVYLGGHQEKAKASENYQRLMATYRANEAEKKLRFDRDRTQILAEAQAAAARGDDAALVAQLSPWETLLDPAEIEALAKARAALASVQKIEDEKNADAAELKSAAPMAVELAKRKVPQSLRDPDSAKFRDVFAVATDKGGLVVCGKVNAKNAFGGYTGYTSFMFNSQITVLEEQVEAAEFVKAWNAMCAERPVLARAQDD